MNRIMTALALSGMLLAAPAFAKTKSTSTKSVATAGDKAEGSTDAAAKPAKKPSKKSKKSAAKAEGSSEKPAEAPAK